jgi:hypothetical protein
MRTNHKSGKAECLIRLSVKLALVGVGLVLTGCGSDNDSSSNPAATAKTGTFFADPVPVNGGTARGYVTLNAGVPIGLGVELSTGVLTQLPNLAANDAQATFASFPMESSVTPFRALAIGYFGESGHPPAGVGDVPHFHPILLLNPVQMPDPPDFVLETKPVAAAEIPADHVKLEDVAPGIGVAYQDPAQPQNQPGWDSIGQNYFFYGGHMNAYALGATNTYMQRLQAGTDIARGDVIKQPQVYPIPGAYYPHRYTVSYDEAARVFRFELTDFQRQ